jgi:hypothetical protein
VIGASAGDGYIPVSLFVMFPGRGAEVAAAWAKPVQSDLVTTTSASTVMVVMTGMLFNPRPVKVVTEKVVDLVSHDVGIVY